MDYNLLYKEIQTLNDPDLEAGSVWPDREDVLQILKKASPPFILLSFIMAEVRKEHCC